MAVDSALPVVVLEPPVDGAREAAEYDQWMTATTALQEATR